MTVSSKNPPGGERRKTFSVNVCILLSGYNKRNLIARNIRSPPELSMTPRMGSGSELDEACGHRVLEEPFGDRLEAFSEPEVKMQPAHEEAVREPVLFSRMETLLLRHLMKKTLHLIVRIQAFMRDLPG